MEQTATGSSISNAMWTFVCKYVSALILGRRPDCHRGVADRLHRVRVRRLGGVHRHPPQDEDEETHRVQEEEGQLRHH